VVGFVGTPGEKVPEVVVGSAERGVRSVERATGSAERGVRSAESQSRSPESRNPPSPEHRRPQAETRDLPAAKPAISPRARALARDKAIDPSVVRGSGPHGRIVSQDVRNHLASRNYDALRITPAAKSLAQELEIDILTVRGSGEAGRIMVEDVERARRRLPQPMNRMRQVIARRLVESKQTIPHFYVTVTADLTDLMKYRAELKARGVAYSINDFILKAAVLALEEFPIVNSSTDGQSVAWRGDVDLGVAVSVDNGLVVPVLRAAQLLTLAGLRDQARVLADKARAGKLTPDEMTGSSFTISNMGMLNVDSFSAIINPGEAGILAVASARAEPAVVDNEIRVRMRMAMTLSADHRIVDGATGAAFINAIRTKLENLTLWQSLAE
jgi:pyruvate dehydrogenase E2 component (dihydrolipoamide acetyltransferase)